MSGLMRSLKCATIRTGRVLGSALLTSVAFTVYFALISGERLTLMNLVGSLPGLMLFIGCLWFMIYGMVDMVTYTQLTISYGSTRKHALIGRLYMNLLQTIGMVACMYLVYVLTPAEWMPMEAVTACLLAQNVYLIAGSLALVSGMLVYRFGKVAYLIFTVLAALFGGSLAGFGTYAGESGILVSIGANIGDGFCVWDLAGIVLFLIVSVICWFFMRRIEVRV